MLERPSTNNNVTNAVMLLNCFDALRHTSSGWQESWAGLGHSGKVSLKELSLNLRSEDWRDYVAVAGVGVWACVYKK